MTRNDIISRKEYLESLRKELSFNNDTRVANEMAYRAKQVEGILKALVSANINRDNIPGIQLYTKLEKNLTIKKYLNDIFFFDSEKLKCNGTDRILIADANLVKFASGENLNSKDKNTSLVFNNEFSKVIDFVNAAVNYYQIENINLIEEDNSLVRKLWIKLLPSDKYLDLLDNISFRSHEKFFTHKKSN